MALRVARVRWRELGDKFFRDDVLSLAAALAFCTTLSLAPLLVLLLTALAAVDPEMQNGLFAEIRDLMGREAAQALEMVLKNASEHPNLKKVADWGALVTLFISASVMFAQMQSALNTIFEATSPTQAHMGWAGQIRTFFGRRLVCLGMVVVFLLVSVFSLLLSSIISVVEASWWSEVLHFAITFHIYAFLFAALYKFMPDRGVEWSDAWRGGILTAVLFVIGKSLIGLYLGRTAIASAYGAAGSLILLLLWVYYSSLTIFIGAEVSALWTKGQCESPSSLA